MRTKPQDIGRTWEVAVTKAMNEWAGRDVCERITKHGPKDQGDLRLIVDDVTVCVECKRTIAYPSESMMAEFRRQTLEEMGHSGADGAVLVVNHYRQSPLRGEVWMPFGTLAVLDGRADSTEVPEAHEWVCMTLADFCQLCFGDRMGG